MEQRQSRDDVLADAGLTVPQWLAIQRLWLLNLAKEAARGRRSLAERYAAAYGDAAPSLSEQQAEPPSVTEARITAPVTPPAISPMPVVIRELPHTPAMTTTSMPAYLPEKDTPFAGRVAAPRSVADEVAAEAQGMIGATADAMPALTDEQLAQPPIFMLANVTPPPSANIDTTAAVQALDIDPSDALPFVPGQGAAPTSMAADVQAEGQDMVGEPAFVSALSDEDLAGALPFQSSSREPPPSGRELTLEQYTSLVVEINHRAHERSQILTRYGLDEAGFVDLKTRWNRSFGNDPIQYGVFRSLYDQYAAWLASRR
jgi:hypothetical protein